MDYVNEDGYVTDEIAQKVYDKGVDEVYYVLIDLRSTRKVLKAMMLRLERARQNANEMAKNAFKEGYSKGVKDTVEVSKNVIKHYEPEASN